MLLALGFAYALADSYDTQPSGYGDNNAGAVQYVAKSSPKNRLVDYTRTSGAEFRKTKYKLQPWGYKQPQSNGRDRYTKPQESSAYRSGYGAEKATTDYGVGQVGDFKVVEEVVADSKSKFRLAAREDITAEVLKPVAMLPTLM